MNTQNKGVVLTNGCFDLFNSNHCRFLSKIKLKHKNCFLVVGVNSNKSVSRLKGKKRPIVDEYDRSLIVASHWAVDHVFIFDRLEQDIAMYRPSFYYKGGDYDINSIDPKEKRALKEVGSKIGFIKVENPCPSTTQYIREIKRL